MRILILNQCFYPDVVSTAQHAADLARALTAAGHTVTAVSSNRGYDDPSVRFPLSSKWQGGRVIRVPCLAMSKKTRLGRILNFASFFVTCAARLLFSQPYDVTIALTSPPLISVLGAVFARLRGGSLVFWVMDLNPDEAIAAGWLRAESRRARILDGLLRFSALTAKRVVVLDRFMYERLLVRGVSANSLFILAPWSHDNHVNYDATGRERFRRQHALKDKFVVMYSGNHSPCHSLETLLEAARVLSSEADIAFCFIGGGSQYPKVNEFAQRHALSNILCLPYQPIENLSASLSASDLQVVVMGEPFVGLVHPCKIYNILATGVPALFIGPEPSHITDIADSDPSLPIKHFAHGEIVEVAAYIRRAANLRTALPDENMERKGLEFSANRIVPQWVDLVESISTKE